MAETMKLNIQLDLIDKATREAQRSIRNLSKINNKVKQLTKNEKKLAAQNKRMNKSFKGMNKSVNFLSGKFAALAAGGAITGLFVSATKSALQFENKMAEVSTLTKMSAKEFNNNFSKIVEGIQFTFGKDQQNVIKTLYDGISAGVKPTKKAVKEFLTATGKMAIAGATDMKTAGDALTTVQNAFKKKGVVIGFKEISNCMFGAIKAGKTTARELSASIGNVATMAAATGTSIEEMFGSIATITSKGVDTASATTQINAMLTALIKPTKDASKAFEKLGIKGIGKFMASFKRNKLANTLKEIDKRVKASTTSTADYNSTLSRLFPNIRGYKGVLNLLADDQTKFKSSISDTNRALGQSDEAFKKMQTTQLEYDKAMQALSIVGKQIGNSLLPYLAKSAQFVGDIFQNIQGIVKNADHIERLNREEKQKREIEARARKKAVGESSFFKELFFGSPRKAHQNREKRVQEIMAEEKEKMQPGVRKSEVYTVQHFVSVSGESLNKKQAEQVVDSMVSNRKVSRALGANIKKK